MVLTSAFDFLRPGIHATIEREGCGFSYIDFVARCNYKQFSLILDINKILNLFQLDKYDAIMTYIKDCCAQCRYMSNENIHNITSA